MEVINRNHFTLVIVLMVSVVGAAFLGGFLFATRYESLHGSIGMLSVVFHFVYLLLILLGSIVELVLLLSRFAASDSLKRPAGD